MHARSSGRRGEARRRRTERVLAGITLGALLLLGPRSGSVQVDEAIGASCVDCHGVIVDEYRASGMARAVEPLRPGELGGLSRVEDHDTGLSYELKEGANGARIIERWGEGEGEVARSLPLLYAIGAGHLDRSYVVQVGGMEWFAPLEVLSEGDGVERHAVLAPGHEMLPGMRFKTPITNECLACHTDTPPVIDYPANLHSASWSPRGISCASCHAAGEEHARSREAKDDGEDPALAIDELDLAGRISICARCHLQGDARISLSGSRAMPPAGTDFLEEWAVYLPRSEDEGVAFVSQVERMLTSVCFTSSLEEGAQPLECTTCHDPHRSLTDEAERAHVRAACMQCHESGDEECSRPDSRETAQDCVDCHMPLVGVFDVGAVRIHDHEISRSPASPSTYLGVRVKHARDGDVARFQWPWMEPAPLDPGLEMMAALIAGGEQRALARVDGEPGATTRKLSTYHHLRAVLLEKAGRLDEARKSYLRALVMDPDSGESTVNLALLLGRMNRAQEGIVRLDELLEHHPQAEGAWRNRGLLKSSLGDVRGFASDLEIAQAILPRAELARALAQIKRRLGDESGAKLWEERARQLGP